MRLLQVKTEATDGYNSVQVGYRVCKEKTITKPQLNHLKKAGAPPMRRLKEYRVRLICYRWLCRNLRLLMPLCTHVLIMSREECGLWTGCLERALACGQMRVCTLRMMEL